MHEPKHILLIGRKYYLYLKLHTSLDKPKYGLFILMELQHFFKFTQSIYCSEIMAV